MSVHVPGVATTLLIRLAKRSPMAFQKLSFDVGNGVAVVTLEEPPANTYSYDMMRKEVSGPALRGAHQPSWAGSRG